MFSSKFTIKLLLITIIPIIFFSFFVIFLNVNQITKLSTTTASITKDGLEKIYESHMQKIGHDISQKINLKLDSVKNELNILRGSAQKLIDEEQLKPYGEKIQEIEYLKNDFEYNKEKNWSNLKKKDIDISMSTWGYLHNSNGEITQETINYTTLMSPLKPLMSSIGKYGIEKSWFYVAGPKKTPVMIMTPWAQMPAIFDKKYPGHNTNNWWDFFFPGIVEGWEKWIANPKLRPASIADELTLTPLYEDAGGTGLMVTFFAPLWNKERTKNEGAAALDYNIENISSLIKNETIGKTGFSFLMKSDGSVLSIQDKWADTLGLKKNEQNRDSGVKKSYYKLTESSIQDIQTVAKKISDHDYLIQTINNNGKEYIVLFENVTKFNLWTGNDSEIKEDSLYLGMIVPKNEILEVHYQLEEQIKTLSEDTRKTFFLLSALLIFITLTLIILFTIKETKQIRMLTDGAKQVKDKKYGTIIPVISQNELGELTQTFNGMIQDIQASYIQLENYAYKLEEEVKVRTKHLEEANIELEKLSLADGLTGVHNRRYLDENLELKWKEHQRNKTPLSVLMMDIDYFKKYNDTYGHQAGDECLIQVANALQNALKRPTDILARYGGEEFCVVIAGNRDEAIQVAELLRSSVESLNLEHKSSDKGIISISIGVNSIIPNQNENIKNFIENSDNALYESKEKGRDKVSFYEKK